MYWKILIPGLIDTHSHIGGGSGADGSRTANRTFVCWTHSTPRPKPETCSRGWHHHGQRYAGSDLLSGQTLYLKLRGGTTIDDLLIRCAGSYRGRDQDGQWHELDSRGGGPVSGTRSKSAALQREIFLKAQAYRDEFESRRRQRQVAPARPRDWAVVESLKAARRPLSHASPG
jgi:hypothetical protein